MLWSIINYVLYLFDLLYVIVVPDLFFCVCCLISYRQQKRGCQAPLFVYRECKNCLFLICFRVILL